MKKVNFFTGIVLSIFFGLTLNNGLQAQTFHPLVPDNYVFDADSLNEFDEEAAKQVAFNVGAFGEEYKVFMYFAKRSYINSKFNLNSGAYSSNAKGGSPNVSPLISACVNEDFEEHGNPANTYSIQGAPFPAGSTITITSPTQIPGWNCTRGVTPQGTAAICPSYTSGITLSPNAISVMNPGRVGA